MRLQIPILRDLAMLTLGSGGMARELFLEPRPDMVRVTISVGLLLGPAALWVWWHGRNPSSLPPGSGPTDGSSSSSPSSSLPRS